MENVKTCPNDCTRCTPMQRQLCAAQFAMMNAKRMDYLEERLERIEDLQKKMANDNSGVFNPMDEQEFKEAQGDSGAENRLSRE